MTTLQFDEFVNEVIPQQLFHVTSEDIDPETGASLEEVILIGLIAQNMECLKHRPLMWYIEHFLHSNL